LTPITRERLTQVGIRRAQITIDGPEEYHNARRPLRGGGTTFDEVLNNAVEASQSMEIALRVSIDEELAREEDAVYDFIKSLIQFSRGRVKPYLAPVLRFEGKPGSSTRGNLTYAAFYDYLYELYSRFIDDGIPISFYVPQYRGSACSALHGDSMVIAPDGRLFKCWEDPGDPMPRCVGSLATDAIDVNEAMSAYTYSTLSSSSDPKCRCCELLPVCMGGCPKRVIQYSEQERRYDICELYKSMMPKFVRLNWKKKTRMGNP
jgi:uncharacterized protein